MQNIFVAYYRVSTARQGESRLGLDAQQQAVTAFAASCEGIVTASFEEIESGKNAERPALAEAMLQCRLTGARLLIAKLDRLSRDAHFLLGLEKNGLDFIACDMPHANKLTVGIMALVAQQEREAISARTKAALGTIRATIKVSGSYTTKAGRSITRLGSPTAPTTKVNSALGTAALRRRADSYAASVAPLARSLMQSEGSLARVAERLNAARVRTARIGRWQPMTVKRVLDRVTNLPA